MDNKENKKHELESTVDSIIYSKNAILFGGIGLVESAIRTDSPLGAFAGLGAGIAGSYFISKAEKKLLKKPVDYLKNKVNFKGDKRFSKYVGGGVGFGTGMYMLYKYFEKRNF